MIRACQTVYPIKYVLTVCMDFAPIREIFYSASNMKELFKKTKNDALICIRKAECLYGKKFKSDNSENY